MKKEKERRRRMQANANNKKDKIFAITQHGEIPESSKPSAKQAGASTAVVPYTKPPTSKPNIPKSTSNNTAG